MALRLLLMRHGKSDWSANFSTDHERPLAPRGQKASRRMGKLIRESGQYPSKILCSTAQRTQETLHYFLEGCGQSIPVNFVSDFYESSTLRVLNRLKSEDNADSLMILGHEPVWSNLASQLIGGGAIAFPTAAIARIDCEISRWSQLQLGSGELKWLLQPKFFK